MSPEQARGRRVDKRTDIWAFGCVLFEMLTGRSPFDADTTSDVIARILERDPPWQQLPADVPVTIQKMLKRCLQKDANERLHDIADARLEIAEAMALVGSDPTRGRYLTSRRWLWPALAIAALVTIAVVAYRWTRPGSFGSPVELGIMFPENFVPSVGVAVSPDGRHVATSVTAPVRQIWMHTLETGETRPVPGTERGVYPFWSPDGRRLAFFQVGVLKAINLSDGSVFDICKVGNNTFGATWTRDGRVIVAQNDQLYVVPAAGGELRLLTRLKGSVPVSFPQLLPDGRHVLFYSRDLSGGWAAAASVQTGEIRRLVPSSGAAVFAAPDRLLYVRGASIVAQRFDPARLALDGEPEVVANGVGPGALVTTAEGTISASSTAVLAFITERGGRAGQLTWFDRAGRSERAVKPAGEGEYLNPAIAPNGDRVAVNRMDPQTGNWDVWIVNAATGMPAKLTSDDAIDSDAIWSPDGREVVFSSTRGGQLGLYRQIVDGVGSAEPLYISKSARVLTAGDWTRDGKFLVYFEIGTSPASIWLLPLTSDRKPTLLLNGWNPRVSPDGQWIAYMSPESGTVEVYTQRFPSLGSKQRISQGGGVHPRWISDGRELAYWAIPGGVNAANIIRGAPVGETRAIIQAPILSVIDSRTHYDVSGDGRRFLARQPAGPPGPGIKVVLNWTARLK
jgi:Tol biopolymer transport system component